MEIKIGRWPTLVFLIFTALHLFGQKMTSFPLEDMLRFKPQDGNWSIVGSVFMDPKVDVHTEGNKGITFTEGTGILLNMTEEGKKSNLFTRMEHGDIEIEFEFMMPKGSNSGFYLQGRYEIQLMDSWGVKQPKFSDLGGVYRNWENEVGKIYMGKSPLVNAAKAPGLWQKMYISFSAPVFDEAGKKIKNAKLNLVTINGAIVHENVELPLPTGGAVAFDEVAKGPIFLQGDHGAVAFKNIKYRLISPAKASIDQITYDYFKGPYTYESDFITKKPTKSGSSPEGLTWEVSEVKDFFALHLTGQLEVPEDGNYYLSSIHNGNLAIYIDGDTVMKNKTAWEWDNLPKNEVFLTAGKHTAEFFYSRKDNWRPPALGVFIESDKMALTPLHLPSSLILGTNIYPLKVDASQRPKILRAFLDFDGDGRKRRTHTIGVGDPSGIHYIFDNDLGVISCIWKGNFIDATPMWDSRGDGSFRPDGTPIYLDNTLQVETLESENMIYNTSVPQDAYKPMSYTINSFTGSPLFNYKIGANEFKDEIYADGLSNALIREISLKEGSTLPENMVFRAAHGKKITPMSEGMFSVDGAYYIKLETSNHYYIRTIDGNDELLVKFAQPSIRYQLIW